MTDSPVDVVRYRCQTPISPASSGPTTMPAHSRASSLPSRAGMATSTARSTKNGGSRPRADDSRIVSTTSPLSAR